MGFVELEAETIVEGFGGAGDKDLQDALGQDGKLKNSMRAFIYAQIGESRLEVADAAIDSSDRDAAKEREGTFILVLLRQILNINK